MAGVAGRLRTTATGSAGRSDQRMQNRIFKNARILIVDDEAANVGLLQRLLERAGFDRVEAPPNPAEAAGCTSSTGPT